MPDSKLVEKLGFEIKDGESFVQRYSVKAPHIYESGAVPRPVTEHEWKLWSLCLQQERLLELYRAKRASDGGPGREWHAGKHLAAEEAIEIAERKDA